MMRSFTLRRIVIVAAIAAIVGYALFEARGLLRGPVIVIESPRSGTTVTDPLIHIMGTARRITSISMNERPIFISEEGRIDEPVALLPGYNEITFTGTDRFGNTTTVHLALLYRPSDEETLPPFLNATTPDATTTISATTSEGF